MSLPWYGFDRRFGWALLFAVIMVADSAAHTSVSPADTDKRAPAFSLTDTEGRTHALSDFKGKIVILEWMNPECPYVQRHYRNGAMLEARRRVRAVAPNAVWLAIDSTSDATARDRQAWRAKYDLPYPILLDADGVVGRSYNARRTPHMYVIDTEGVLRYHGAIDDNRLGRKPRSEVTNYVVAAVRQITSGQSVAPSFVKPYGCSVKYAPTEGHAADAR